MVTVQADTAQCALPLIRAQILSDGTSSFCGCANFDDKSELRIGKIANTTLREMMASDSVKKLWTWTEFGMPELCKSCPCHMPIDRLAALPGACSDPPGTFGG
jgi:hypothetical protein